MDEDDKKKRATRWEPCGALLGGKGLTIPFLARHDYDSRG